MEHLLSTVVVVNILLIVKVGTCIVFAQNVTTTDPPVTEYLSSLPDVNTAPQTEQLNYLEFEDTFKQVLIPQLNFTCYGTITSYSGLAVARSVPGLTFLRHQISFTVWRPRGQGLYDVVAHDVLQFRGSDLNQFDIDNSTGGAPEFVYVPFTNKEPERGDAISLTPSGPISFQPGDIIGWNSHLQSEGIIRALRLVYTEGSFDGLLASSNTSQLAPCTVSECDSDSTSQLPSIVPYLSVQYVAVTAPTPSELRCESPESDPVLTPCYVSTSTTESVTTTAITTACVGTQCSNDDRSGGATAVVIGATCSVVVLLILTFLIILCCLAKRCKVLEKLRIQTYRITTDNSDHNETEHNPQSFSSPFHHEHMRITQNSPFYATAAIATDIDDREYEVIPAREYEMIALHSENTTTHIPSHLPLASNLPQDQDVLTADDTTSHLPPLSRPRVHQQQVMQNQDVPTADDIPTVTNECYSTSRLPPPTHPRVHQQQDMQLTDVQTADAIPTVTNECYSTSRLPPPTHPRVHQQQDMQLTHVPTEDDIPTVTNECYSISRLPSQQQDMQLTLNQDVPTDYSNSDPMPQQHNPQNKSPGAYVDVPKP